MERGNRVFPVSDRSFDISGALERELRRLRVRILRERAAEITAEDGRVTGVQTDRQHHPADAVVLATRRRVLSGHRLHRRRLRHGGGAGAHHRAAQGLAGARWRAAMPTAPPCQGLSLRNVEATVLNGKNKPVFREFGEMLFTHFGVSGPLMLSASAHLRRWDKEQYRLSIDLKPALDQQKLDSRIPAGHRGEPQPDMPTSCPDWYTGAWCRCCCAVWRCPEGEKANSLTKEQRRALVQELKHFTVSLTGPRPVAEAIVTAGGVKVGDVVPGTMASKLAEGLYFAGEILDVDAYTGGFNLQIAWATRISGGSFRRRAARMKHMNERRYAVAVDGPSGAGKSTLAKAAAERLGILYVDTGAHLPYHRSVSAATGHRPPRHVGGAGRAAGHPHRHGARRRRPAAPCC